MVTSRTSSTTGAITSRADGLEKAGRRPYDIPVPGYGTNTVNLLHLWESRASEKFAFEAFNRGGYEEAVREKNHSETISKVLYPNDKTKSGKELRLVQQYFFVACSLKDIIRRFLRTNDDWEGFPEKVAIQLHDTHPAICIRHETPRARAKLRAVGLDIHPGLIFLGVEHSVRTPVKAELVLHLWASQLCRNSRKPRSPHVTSSRRDDGVLVTDFRFPRTCPSCPWDNFGFSCPIFGLK
jgi:Carbohydrate phosphorylase